MLTSTEKWITGGALAVWLMLAWILGAGLALRGRDLWIFRGGLAALGLAGAGGFVLLRSRSGGGGTPAPKAAARGPIGQLFREAAGKLQRSRKGAPESLPAFVVLGEAGSAKTTTIVRSGLEPELLAGQAFEENVVTPTRDVNIWFARDTLFIDPAGGLLDDPQRRAALIASLTPGRLGSVFGRKASAPRAAVVCVDCGLFTGGAGSQAVQARAAQLREQLGEICQRLGISLPVYVLFTKLDRVGYFAEFVRNLSREEAADVFGIALPMGESGGNTVYSHEASQRMHSALNEMFARLVMRRPEMLEREHDGTALSPIYEFPREFSKFRSLVSQFLVELCKPSELHANPFLRGFYFTGVRAVVVSEVAAAPARARAAEAPGFSADATRLFHSPSYAPVASPAAPVSRKVPEWVYLPRIFPEILLRDTAALSTSTASSKVALWQRVLLGSAAVLALLYIVAATVSFFNNKALVERGLQAGQAASVAQIGPEGISADDLRQLDTLRASLAEIRSYRRDGVPMSLGWGLYAGEDAYPHLHRAYFGAFLRSLLSGSHESILATLTRRTTYPNTPPKDVYDALKAYLITTSHPHKSQLPFLANVLRQHWAGARKVDDQRMELAWKQFAFYGEVLPEANPLPSLARPDEIAVEKGREYLARFAATDAIYNAMLLEAGQRRPPIRLADFYPGSGEVIESKYTVPAAFGKPAWEFVQNAVKTPERYFTGEEWVLGERALRALDRVKLGQELRTRYQNDFLRHWREFIRGTRVMSYGSLADAANKLTKLAGNQSPLLGSLCLASENTVVDVPEIKDVFQPPQQVTPPGCKSVLGGSGNQSYMEALIKLQAAVAQFAANPGPAGEAHRAQANAEAVNALITTAQVARSFSTDRGGDVDLKTRRLLEDPITNVQRLLKVDVAGPVNAAAKQFCATVRPLTAKYPFSPRASQEATLQEVAALLRPGEGTLWQFYERELKAVLTRQGNEFVVNPSAPMKFNPAFLTSLSRMAALSEMFFREGAKEPKFDFSVRLATGEDVQSLQMHILGQTVRLGPKVAQKLTWPGKASDVRLTPKFTGGSEFEAPMTDPGLWAPFRFFGEFSGWEPAPGSEYLLSRNLNLGTRQIYVPNTNRPVVLRLLVDAAGAQMFRPGSLAFSCVAEAAR
jgi:type VI secretion system protein ImpL